MDKIASRKCRESLIKKAYNTPEIREHVLPLIKKAMDNIDLAKDVAQALATSARDEIAASASVGATDVVLYDEFIEFEARLRSGGKIELEFTITGSRQDGQTVDFRLSHLVINGEVEEPNAFGLSPQVDDMYFDRNSKSFDRKTTQALRNIAEAAEQGA